MTLLNRRFPPCLQPSYWLDALERVAGSTPDGRVSLDLAEKYIISGGHRHETSGLAMRASRTQQLSGSWLPFLLADEVGGNTRANGEKRARSFALVWRGSVSKPPFSISTGRSSSPTTDSTRCFRKRPRT